MKTGFRRHIITLLAALAILPNVNGQATSHCDSLIAVVKTMPDNEQKLSMLHDICSEHNNVDTVLAYAKLMCKTADNLKNSSAHARAHQFLGWCYANMGDYEEALDNHYRALVTYDEIGDSVGMARCYNATGEDFLDLKNYYTADEYFHKALNIYNTMGLESEMPSIYRNLGSMYKDYKLYETAKRYFSSAIGIDTKCNSATGLIIDYCYLASTEHDEYHETNDASNIRRAMQYNNLSYEKATELNDSTYLLYVLQNSLPINLDYSVTLDTAERQHLLDSCAKICQMAMVYSTEHGYQSNYYKLENSWARLLLLNNKYDECLKMLETVSQEQNDMLGAATKIDYDCYIDCYIAMGNFSKALEYKRKRDLSDNQEYYLETTLNSSKSSTKEDFEQMLRQQEKEKKKRELMFEERKKMSKIINISACVIIAFLIVFVIVSLKATRNKQENNKRLLQQKDEYEIQRNILSNINIQITDSIRYAKEIQNSIIPPAKVMNAIFGDRLTIWKPLDIVSGDFYWATQKGRYKLLAVGDCLRHGVPGAFTSMLGITTLNDIASAEVSDDHCPTAAMVLDKLRNKIENAIPHSSDSEPANLIDIALCIIDSENNTMQFAGAHNPIFIIRKGELVFLPSDDIHIGNSNDSHIEFTNTEINLQTGDVLYLYTDGITLQLNSEWNYSTDILTDLLKLIYDKPFAEQHEYINYALSKSPKKNDIVDQVDDILLIGIRI